MSIAASPLVWTISGTFMSYTRFTRALSSAWLIDGSPRHPCSPPGPPVRYALLK